MGSGGGKKKKRRPKKTCCESTRMCDRCPRRPEFAKDRKKG